METTKYDLTGTLLGDKSNTIIFENTKIKQLVPDFEATTMLEQGVKKVIETMLTDKTLQIEDPEFNEWCDNVVKYYARNQTKNKNNITKIKFSYKFKNCLFDSSSFFRVSPPNQ